MRRVALLLFCAALAGAAGPVPVWIDTDPSVAPGGKEIDDGVALLQAFASPELRIHGVSIVFGNAGLQAATRIGREIVTRFGPKGLGVHPGAASAAALGVETAASRALASALRRRRMTILVLGPATNIATVLKNHPELAGRIDAIVAVAGRRPGQRFVAGPKQQAPFRDLNFELDPPAFQVILDAKVPVTLAPWEISSKVWITGADLAAGRTPGLDWLRAPALDWLALWKNQFGADGFNPFDSLAVGVLVDRQDLLCETLSARIEDAPSDTSPAQEPKPYLHVRPEVANGRAVTYCYGVTPLFKDHLLGRLRSK
jgi:pyrimidine-specific ribonucleoside hydrolase